MLADQGGGLERKASVGFRVGAEAGVIDAAEFVLAVQMGGGCEDLAVAGGSGADDHLGGLPGGGELWCERRFATVFVGLLLASRDLAHRGFDDGGLLFGGELDEVLLRGEFDVGGEAVGVEAGFVDEAFSRSRGWS